MSTQNNYCAIDFGTSNSAVALPAGDGIKLVELEPGFTSIPTAVFFSAEDGSRSFGREAVQTYVDGYDGRLMRSIKSILGSDLMDRATKKLKNSWVLSQNAMKQNDSTNSSICRPRNPPGYKSDHDLAQNKD